MSLAELVSCFDENGKPIAPKSRAEIHAVPLRYWHATNGIWVVDQVGKILCSQRAFTCEGNPGKWQSTFGGHVKAGLSWRESAVLELAEEIGLKVCAEDLYLMEKGKSAEAFHLVERYMYVYQYDHPLQFTDGEVIAIEWLTIDQYHSKKAVHPEQWCNGLSLETGLLIRQRLAELV